MNVRSNRCFSCIWLSLAVWLLLSLPFQRKCSTWLRPFLFQLMVVCSAFCFSELRLSTIELAQYKRLIWLPSAGIFSCDRLLLWVPCRGARICDTASFHCAMRVLSASFSVQYYSFNCQYIERLTFERT